MGELKPYTTGYMKPPKQSQFRKGKSGNPKGRPKKIEDPYSVLQKVLMRKVQIKNDGGKLSLEEALIRRLRELAISGDRRAIQMQQRILSLANESSESDAADIDLLEVKRRLLAQSVTNSEGARVDGGQDG